MKNTGTLTSGGDYFCRYGEIDIIAKKDDVLVFVEVKYRKSSKGWTMESAVDRKKQLHIKSSTKLYDREI